MFREYNNVFGYFEEYCYFCTTEDLHSDYWFFLFKLLIHFVFYRLSTDRNAGLFLFHCKEKTDSKGQCRLTQFKGKLDKIQLVRFLQSQTLPKYVSISRVPGVLEYKKNIDNSLNCHTTYTNDFLV